MLFRLSDIQKAFGGQNVLHGVTFQVNPAEHIGLVGRNGAGKTTIFRLIAGVEAADKGEVSRLRNLRLGWLEQHPSFISTGSVLEEALEVFVELHEIESELTRLEHLMAESVGESLEKIMSDYSELRHRYEYSGGFTYRARAESVLSGLGFTTDDFSSPTEILSGGQKARLALAKLLLAEPDVILLDEPTNHLDVGAVEWLEDFLQGYRFACIIISHDRFLLDRVTHRIIEIENGKAFSYAGNYSAYIKQKEERQLNQVRRYEQQQELISRTEEFIRRNIAGQKTKQAKSRRKMLGKLDLVEGIPIDEAIEFEFEQTKHKSRSSTPRVSETVLTLKGVTVGYENKPLICNVNLMLGRGNRLGIIGPNGSGKTTLIRTIMGEIDPLDGEISWGANIKLGYHDQLLANLDVTATVIDELASVREKNKIFTTTTTGSASEETELRSFLATFLFKGEEVFKPVSLLSGGEQSKLALAKLIYSRPNLLVLDEPTNHLDIPSREALENALLEFSGTIITISHDRYFLDKICSEILVLENESPVFYLGTYTEFREARRREAEIKAAKAKQEIAAKSVKPALRERSSRKSDQRRRSVEIEGDLMILEAELREVSELLSNPSDEWIHTKIAELGHRHEQLTARIDELYVEWGSLGEESDNP